MILLPAIDLYGKKAVRLYKGDYRQMTVYSDDPRAVAKDFAAAGAQWIHVVDLEGAQNGSAPHLPQIAEIKKESGLLVEVGGGIRSTPVLDAYMRAGIDRAILGTAAVTNEAFLDEALTRYGDRIAVGVDLKDGQVCVKGWTENSGVDAFSFCAQMEKKGVKTLIVTDISRDGAMRGSNRALYADLARTANVRLIASGGVSSLEDVTALRALGLYGAIVGKAYYTGDVNLKEALEAAK